MSHLMGRPALEGRHLTGRALLLLVAILFASVPTSQLLAGSSWLVLTFTGAAPVILGGIVLRRVLPKPMLVPLAQAALIVVLVLVVEIVQVFSGWQGDPLVMLSGQQEIFRNGVNELATGMAPLTLGPNSTVLVVAMIALLTLVLDLMFLDLGWHTPTGLLLMSSILLPALQQPAGGPWWHVAAPVLAGTAILATRTVHADPRYLQGDRRPQAGPVARGGRTLGVSALCLALIAGLSPVPALPQLAPARIALNMDVLNQWQNPDAQRLGPVMIDDDVSVRRSLLQQQDTEVLRYTTTAEQPSYLRLRTLNSFDGETFRATAEGEDVAMGRSSFSDIRSDGKILRDGPAVDYDFQVEDLAGDRLPVPDNVRETRIADPALDSSIQLHPTNGELALQGGAVGLTGLKYSVVAEAGPENADELRSVDPAVFEQPFDVGYTSREEVPEIATELATSVAEDAGAENAFDTALAYQEYFNNSFAYSLTVNSPPGEDPLESFLQDRIGYCEQFASAFALMMTSQGYPTRVAIGFTPGEQDGDQWSVSAKNAHAWPEVWFGPQYGWVRFEPTPSAAANGVYPPQVTDANAQDAAEPTPQDTDPATEASTEASPSSEASTTEEQSSEQASTRASDAGSAGPSAQTVDRIEWGLVSTLGIGALLAAAAAVSVILIRRRRRDARDERWAELLGGADGGGGDGGSGAAPDTAARATSGLATSTLAAERRHRRAGELAWSELTRELAMRDTAIRWLGITGAWGRPSKQIRLDPALPPASALEDLLDQIDAGELDVSAEHRAAASRIAAAFTAATYAAPLPEPGAGDPKRTEDPKRVAGAADVEGVPAGTPLAGPARPQHPLRHDSDQVIELIRIAR